MTENCVMYDRDCLYVKSHRDCDMSGVSEPVFV